MLHWSRIRSLCRCDHAMFFEVETRSPNPASWLRRVDASLAKKLSRWRWFSLFNISYAITAVGLGEENVLQEGLHENTDGTPLRSAPAPVSLSVRCRCTVGSHAAWFRSLEDTRLSPLVGCAQLPPTALSRLWSAPSHATTALTHQQPSTARRHAAPPESPRCCTLPATLATPRTTANPDHCCRSVSPRPTLFHDTRSHFLGMAWLHPPAPNGPHASQFSSHT